MTATREDVLKAFPELGNPAYTPEDGETREFHVQSWLRYWAGLNTAITHSAARAKGRS